MSVVRTGLVLPRCGALFQPRFSLPLWPQMSCFFPRADPSLGKRLRITTPRLIQSEGKSQAVWTMQRPYLRMPHSNASQLIEDL